MHPNLKEAKMLSGIQQNEYRLLRVLDKVLDEYWPIISSLGHKIERSDARSFSSTDKRYTSEATVTIYHAKPNKFGGEDNHFDYAFDVFLYWQGKAVTDKDLEAEARDWMEIFLKKLQKLKAKGKR